MHQHIIVSALLQNPALNFVMLLARADFGSPKFRSRMDTAYHRQCIQAEKH